MSLVVHLLADAISKGGPGSGPQGGKGNVHPATGLTHQQFGTLAVKVGLARNANRDQEDKLRSRR